MKSIPTLILYSPSFILLLSYSHVSGKPIGIPAFSGDIRDRQGLVEKFNAPEKQDLFKNDLTVSIEPAISIAGMLSAQSCYPNTKP